MLFNNISFFFILKLLANLIRRYYILITYLIIITFCIWPTRFATHYKFISDDEIHKLLVSRTTWNISLLQRQHQQRQQLLGSDGVDPTSFIQFPQDLIGNGGGGGGNVLDGDEAEPPDASMSITIEQCSYDDILYENEFMLKSIYREEVINPSEIHLGGEYYPENCATRFSVAILVIYRQREKQLNEFLIYMHNYLRKQKIHYRIFIIDQYDQKPFNRAKLFNIGYIYAKKFNFPCLILHDVDLMPMHLGQLYACTIKPRHMCASLDEFRFNLPYNTLFGGAVAIQTEQYARINGMSNMFHGWGGEDDDFYSRLEAKQIDICRFSPKRSQYAMLLHHKEPKNKDRITYLRTGSLRYHTDGLNSLVYTEKEYKLHNLFTHILVET